MGDSERHVIVVCPASDGGFRVHLLRNADVELFCADAVDAVARGDIACADFALGFAAAVDALASGTMRIGDAAGTIRDAWADAAGIRTGAPLVTAVARPSRGNMARRV